MTTVLPTEEIKSLVDGIARYASAFADYDEVDYLNQLRDELRARFEAISDVE